MGPILDGIQLDANHLEVVITLWCNCMEKSARIFSVVVSQRKIFFRSKLHPETLGGNIMIQIDERAYFSTGSLLIVLYMQSLNYVL